MRLEEVRIQNFCSCADITLHLSDFNPLVGYNNSGKSNVLRAISWLLKKSVLSANTFHDEQLPVIVEGRISSVELDLLPRNQQAQVSPYVSNSELRFRRRQDEPDAPAAQVRVEVFDPAENQWVTNPTGLDNAIGVLFPDPIYVEAMDDAPTDIGKVGAKNTIGLLLKYKVDQIRANNAATLQALMQDLQALGSHLSGPNRLQELVDLEREGTGAISEFFPEIGLHLDIRTPAFDELIKGATVSLSDTQGRQRPFTSFGHGAQRTVQMALVKLLAGQPNRRGQAGSTVVLLIDEPELYLHPQAVERLRASLKALSKAGFQVIFSTHSALMVGRDDVLNAALLYRNGRGETVARSKLAAVASTMAAHSHHATVIFSLQNASYVLFSEKVFIVEGKTEATVLPTVYKVVTGRSVSEDKACFVEGSSSSAIWPMIQILRGVGFIPKAVADLDFVFKVAVQAGLLSDSDPDLAACKAWFVANHAAHGFFIDSNNLPVRRGGPGQASQVDTEAAFELMASAMHDEIASLVAQLRLHDVWVWSRGAIESSLGIAKNDLARVGFVRTAERNGDVTHATYPGDLSDLIAWLQT